MSISIVNNQLNCNSGVHMFYAKALQVQPNKGGLKSTQQKIERMQKAGSQISFWETQKENLKNMQCDNLDEIARKLEMFHQYEDEIAAVKASYNSEQIWHVMDEAREMGEKIAKAIEKSEPKTPEERKEEIREEMADVEEGVLAETLDELLENTEKLIKENMGETMTSEAAVEREEGKEKEMENFFELEMMCEEKDIL